ncbi:uncharacterized protein LAJ45_03875 [Morchella importuna]|uniref:uncharacterized protein n=1 Tax=Morchella importuna TaxID=1174673 RepID=UPI001E8E6278|nr:uncharacterized protein LAJ45_03875 [Morchella importuna]KAH8151882.1 hypothetical protein LAJ45_03875 [Morchella importuna]
MEFFESTLTDGHLAASPHNPETSTTLPTNIHLDLPIPDPHLGFNERTTQWVHDNTWVYTIAFNRTEALDARVCLVFEGLDTFATVSLNGTRILECQNMFRSYRVDVTDIVSMGENKVVMEFRSALKEGDRIMAQNGGERVTWNGHYSRVFVRKAQYHYGWDWGPSLITCGPWKPIRLQIYTDRISNTKIEQALSADLKTAILTLIATTETISLTLTPASTANTWETKHTLTSPELWYPHQHGPPNLYTITFTLKASGNAASTPGPLHTAHKRIGIRRILLIQDPLPQLPDTPVSGGTTFYFNINNTPLFIGGSNWIPAHSFLPAVKTQTLHNLLCLLRDRGNQNMLRIWGGGVYESDELYTLCDELGILVWQDICLACGDYPAHLDSFTSEICAEVRENLERLRCHPSLVIVAGNNEDYQVADEELGYDAKQPEGEWRNSSFPSRWLYEKIFPNIIRDVCNGNTGAEIGQAGIDGTGVVYWPGSPWGGEDSTDRTVGDIHQWNIWGGLQAPYQRYPDLGGRFISEFGMPSYPSISTIKNGFLDPAVPFDENDWNPEAEIIEHHVKAHSFQKRLLGYLGENFRVIYGNLPERIYLSQLLQSEAMNYAYRGWRRRWASRDCGGALVWQLNDVWPVTSWSIIDFHLHPKPAFYTIARALSPIIPIITRTTTNPKPNSQLEALVRSKTTRGAGSHPLHSTPHIYPPNKVPYMSASPPFTPTPPHPSLPKSAPSILLQAPSPFCLKLSSPSRPTAPST